MNKLLCLRWRARLTALSLLVFAPLPFDVTGYAAPAATRVGDAVDGLTLTDLRLSPWKLEDVGTRRLYVFVFIDGLCAAVADVLEPLEALSVTYGDQDVFVAAINANTAESAVDAADHALRHGLTFPVFKDVHQQAKELLGCERTPDAVILDEARRLIYRGAAVDASSGLFLLESLVQKSVNDQPIDPPERPGAGCLIRTPRPLGERKVSYAQHVAPVLEDHCVRCHSTDSVAPFPLDSLAAAQPHAEAIRRAIEERRMPPIFASQAAGKLLDQTPLSRKEIELLRLWHHSGASGEAPSPDKPESPVPPDSHPAAPVAEPAAATDGGPQVEERTYNAAIPKTSRPIISHSVDKSLSRHVWVVDCDLRPSLPGAIRHAWLLAHPPGGGRPSVVAVYTPEGSFFPKGENRAMFIAERSRLVLRVDPHPDRTENATVHIRLSNTFVTPRNELACLALVGPPFLLAPGPTRQMVRRLFAAPEPCEMLAFVPMLSSFVRDATLQIEPRPGDPEVLLRLPAYDPGWQRPYQWAPGPTFDFGAYIALVTHHDPPPERRVFGGWGPRSESHAGFIYYIRDPIPADER